MGAFKDIDPVKGRKAICAWDVWMDKKIRIVNPELEDLVAVPADIWAAAMVGKLPPGWEWVDDEAREIN